MQFDLFATAPTEPPTNFRRTWRDGRNYAHLLVSKIGDVWCYGMQVQAGTCYFGFAPLPKWNQRATFQESLDAGMAALVTDCRRDACSPFDSAPAFGRLLRVIENTAPEQHEAHEALEDIAAKWTACVAAGMVP